ncbi:MAG: response regulator [Wenzhouxiangella sp.]
MSSTSAESKLRELAVLVVDDHRINREFLSAGLRDSVARLDLAADGASAIDYCRERVYDVILMDLHMPQMDGMATAHRIRDLDGPSARARIVALTADTRPEVRSRLLTGGFDAFLNKPLSITELKDTIWELFVPARARPVRVPKPISGSEPLIDAQRALSNAGDKPQAAAELGAMLSLELTQKLQLLDQMLKQQRIDDAGALLHQWTGAAGFAGAVRFSRSCAALRRELLEPASSSPGTAYMHFLRVAHATRQALDESCQLAGFETHPTVPAANHAR